MDFELFFEIATDGFISYPYQQTFAESSSLPSLLQIPTGLGKTETAIIGWLWRRFYAPSTIRKETPTRLVYCLPMRVLVEQTIERAKTLLGNLADEHNEFNEVPVYKLMGGELEREWVMNPDEEAILVGTQDMLLSRALNRGYASSRFRWPLEYGLLNNDVLWVLDEVQLMQSGLFTSLQLQAFRKKWETYGPTQSVWMSATCEPDWLETVDKDRPRDEDIHELGPSDLERDPIQERISASKPLDELGLRRESTSDRNRSRYLSDLSDHIQETYQEVASSDPSNPPLLLVILNTVQRAQDLYQNLNDSFDEEESGVPDLHLLHSRFRPPDRRRLNAIASQSKADESFPEAGRILVATQVVEAGVDLSADHLLTELAPWTSLVQRFGRLNRYGERNEGRCAVVDIKTDGRNAEDLCAPYDPSRLESARSQLEGLDDVNPLNLTETPAGEAPEARNVIRDLDLKELFDTTPDLMGKDIDIAPYIRDDESRNVSVFWRFWEPGDEAPPESFPPPYQDELCSVPLGSFQGYLEENNRSAWHWNEVQGTWERVYAHRLQPGQTLLLSTSDGGYDPGLGWSPSSEGPVSALDEGADPAHEQPNTDSDYWTTTRVWKTLQEHSKEVRQEARDLLASLSSLGLPEHHRGAVLTAAYFHDLGKAHPVFQDAIKDACDRSGESPPESDTLWAKTGLQDVRLEYKRDYFRHELASALTVLQNEQLQEALPESDPDLVAYLVGAHHGKIRMSIRSLPDEEPPSDGDQPTLYARGIYHGDTLPALSLDGVRVPETALDLSPMEMGLQGESESWVSRVTALRDREGLGPFRLGLLEALVRIADQQVSAHQGVSS